MINKDIENMPPDEVDLIDANFKKAINEFRFNESGENTFRLNPKIIKNFHIKWKEVESAKGNKWPAISIWRFPYFSHDLEKYLLHDKSKNKYKWISGNKKIYGSNKDIFLFDDLISKNLDTVYICNNLWDAFAFFDKTGIMPVCLKDDDPKINDIEQVKILLGKTVVMLNHNKLVIDLFKYSDLNIKVKIVILKENEPAIENFFYQEKKSSDYLFEIIDSTEYYQLNIDRSRILEYSMDANYDDIIQAAIKQNFEIRYNTIKNQMEIKYLNGPNNKWNMITDRAENDVLLTLRKYEELKRLNETALRQNINSSFVPEFNPFYEYFLNTDISDDTDYLKQVADCIKTDLNCESYKYEYLKMWFVGVVAQLFPLHEFEEKYKLKQNHNQMGRNQYCLIIQGAQGKNKTTWFEHISRAFGDGYFHSGEVEPSEKNKDSVEKLASMAIIHLDELADRIKNHKTLERYKSMIAGAQTINVRKAYGKHNTTMYRHASFCASINDANDLLDDHSGARRWMILTGCEFDKKIFDIDPDKFWAQIFKLYISGFKNWYDDHAALNERNELYRRLRVEEELVLKAIEEDVFKNQIEDKLSSTDIILLLTKKYEVKNLSPVIIGKVCRKNFNYVIHGGMSKYLIKEPKKTEKEEELPF